MRREWNCTSCGKLLGVIEGDRLHIQFAKGYQYIVGFPASAICQKCRTLNEIYDEKLADVVKR